MVKKKSYTIKKRNLLKSKLSSNIRPLVQLRVKPLVVIPSSKNALGINLHISV